MAAIYLKRGKLDRLNAGHPWIYANEVEKTTGAPQGGDIVDIRDHKSRYLGRGYYNARSQIVVRRLTRAVEDINEAFFRRRLEAAVALRQPLPACGRLVSSEGDFLPGLIVDKYGTVLVLQALTLGVEKRKEMLVKQFSDLLHPDLILERSDMPSRKLEGLELKKGILWPQSSAISSQSYSAAIKINGLDFSADLFAGQKTGFFLDQQQNYRIVADLVASHGLKRVLDCFCYQGAFALQTAKAGATEIICVDMSEDALIVARKNAELNDLADRCEWICANVFDYLSAATKQKSTNPRSPIPDPFDLIILDPPSFTRTRESLDSALRGYKEIHLRALKLLRAGGYLATFCCSHHIDAALFRSIAVSAATDARRDLRLIRALTQSPDHPILPAVPETEYLKGFIFQVV